MALLVVSIKALVVSIRAQYWWSVLGAGGDEGMFPISRSADSPGLSTVSSVHKAILSSLDYTMWYYVILFQCSVTVTAI